MLYTTGADKSLCSWNMNSLSEQKRIAVSATIYVFADYPLVSTKYCKSLIFL
jgi:hypothetical protein